MNKEQIEAWYFSHPTIQRNIQIKASRGLPIFLKKNDKVRDIVKFCKDYWKPAGIMESDLREAYGEEAFLHGYYDRQSNL